LDIKFVIFCAISAVTLITAAVVAFSRNIVYSAFALLGVFAGVFGLYMMLSADFVAVIQLVIYIGGILVLIIFAVMMTTRIDKASGERRLLNRAMEPVSAFIVVAILGGLIFLALMRSSFVTRLSENFVPTTAYIGNKLLQEYLLPFEIVSVLLVLVMAGAVVLGRKQ
jgi:NADH-quinone oxidoreductase subunit J